MMPGFISGFYGKLPARGDFIRAGLPRSFTDPWDDWLQAALPQSRTDLGDAWLDCWMEAPIWRFCLPAGACGPTAVLGLFLPSVDRAGRHFPLTIACLTDAETGALAAAGADWLESAEQIGLGALERDLPPETLTERLAMSPPPGATGYGGDALWWTAGSPHVDPTSFRLAGLPPAQDFATMLRSSVAHSMAAATP